MNITPIHAKPRIQQCDNGTYRLTATSPSGIHTVYVGGTHEEVYQCWLRDVATGAGNQSPR